MLLLIVSILLIIIFNRSFNYGKKNLQKIHVTCSDISGGDAWIVAYIITYLLPLAEFQLGGIIKPIIGIVIVLLLMTMTFTDFMTPHPRYDEQNEMEREITRRVNEANIGPLGLRGDTSVIATFMKVGPQRASGVRIVCVRPACCFEPRIATVDLQ